MQNFEDCLRKLLILRFLDLLNLILDEIDNPFFDVFISLSEIVFDSFGKQCFLLRLLLENSCLFDPKLALSGKLSCPKLVSSKLTLFEGY